MKKLFFSILLAAVLTLSLLNFNVQAGTVPTIYIQGVTQDEKVTISTKNFPANKVFIARMGKIGTKGVNGITVGSVESGAGGVLKFTFEIPEELMGQSQIAIRLDSTTGGFYSYNWFYNKTAGSHTGGVPADEISGFPVISVLSVKEDTHVVMKIEGFPVGEDIDVLMDEYGTKGIDGVLVANFEPESNEALIMVFDIPESLKSESKIDIRFESQDSDLALYTSFENTTGSCGGECDYTGIPTFSITDVVAGKTVTIKTNNFPKDIDFVVMMGKMWTQGIDGIEITTINSGEGGSFTATFEIPEALEEDYRISIRLEATKGGYYAYNWFYNNTTNGVEESNGYTGIPTFSITAVVKNNTVTIKTNNFPADVDFNVLMGKMWTQGINGTYVTTINSGDGGTFTLTFDIPEVYEGYNQISIRLEATSGGYYAYNWFYNVTYP